MKTYKHSKYQYSIKLPGVVFEMFQSRVMDYHFKGLGDVMNRLMESYIRMHGGGKGKPSKTMQKVLSHADKLPNQSLFFRYTDKTVFSFESTKEISVQMVQLAEKQGYGTRNKLSLRLIYSFIASAHVTLRNLAEEMSSCDGISNPDGYMIHTYVSNYQHMLLMETAKASRMSLMALLTAAADTFLQMDENDGFCVRGVLREMIEPVLEIRGYTTKEFRRDKQVAIRTNGIGTQRISRFMQQYGIASPREFLRRVILFFLEARFLIGKGDISVGEDMPVSTDDDYEGYMNEQYARKDFVRSIYSQ